MRRSLMRPAFSLMMASGLFSVVGVVMKASGGRCSWHCWQCESSLPAAILEPSEPPCDLTSLTHNWRANASFNLSTRSRSLGESMLRIATTSLCSK